MSDPPKTKKKKLKIKWNQRGRKRAITPLHRFRQSVRKVIVNLNWLSDTTEVEPVLDNPAMSEYIESHRRGREQLLLRSDKIILLQSPDARSKSAIEQLADKVSNFESLKKIDKGILKSALRTATFTAYHRPTVIFRKNFYNKLVYVLVHGKVIAYSERLKDGFPMALKERLNIGGIIGMFPILGGTPTSTEVVTYSPTEWLIFGKEDFIKHILPVLRESYTAITNSLTKFHVFNQIDIFEKRNYISSGTFESLEEGKVIRMHSDKDKRKMMSFFIVEGSVAVYQLLRVYRDTSVPYPHLALDPDQKAPRESDTPAHDRLIVRTMDFGKGGMFGFGEKMSELCIAVTKKATLMILPQQLLNFYQRVTMNLLKSQLDDAYPSDELIFREIVRERQKNVRKMDVAAPKRKIHGNSPMNISLIGRGREALRDSKYRTKLDSIVQPGKKFVFNLSQKSYNNLAQEVMDMVPHLPISTSHLDLKRESNIKLQNYY